MRVSPHSLPQVVVPVLSVPVPRDLELLSSNLVWRAKFKCKFHHLYPKQLKNVLVFSHFGAQVLATDVSMRGRKADSIKLPGGVQETSNRLLERRSISIPPSHLYIHIYKYHQRTFTSKGPK